MRHLPKVALTCILVAVLFLFVRSIDSQEYRNHHQSGTLVSGDQQFLTDAVLKK